MSYLYVNEWLFFVISEGLTWIFLGIFLFNRYTLRFVRLNRLFLTLIIFCTIFQFGLVFIDYYITKHISLFQIIIILFIVYAMTLGSADIQRLDKYLLSKFTNHRSVMNEDLYSYVNYRKNLFLIHTIAIVFVHFIWLIADNSITLYLRELKVFMFTHTYLSEFPLLFNLHALNRLSFIWIIMYCFDLFIYLIYTSWQIKNP